MAVDGSLGVDGRRAALLQLDRVNLRAILVRPDEGVASIAKVTEGVELLHQLVLVACVVQRQYELAQAV